MCFMCVCLFFQKTLPLLRSQSRTPNTPSSSPENSGPARNPTTESCSTANQHHKNFFSSDLSTSYACATNATTECSHAKSSNSPTATATANLASETTHKFNTSTAAAAFTTNSKPPRWAESTPDHHCCWGCAFRNTVY